VLIWQIWYTTGIQLNRRLKMSFDELGLDPKILKAVHNAGYSIPTHIQLQAIPKIIEGFDIKASAQTGTGKTAAFLLPALHKLITSPAKKGGGPRVLILVPTRELAMQIAEQTEKYGKYLNHIKSACVVGGVAYHMQMRKLSRPYDVLIATPGRLIDYIHQKKMDFSRLELLVLDEADRMLDMGFIKPVEEIVAATPSSRQTLLFSATLKGGVVKLAQQFLKNPIEIAVHSEQLKHESIEQRLHYADNLGHKNRLLSHILNTAGVDHTIVFTSTKRHADQLVRELKDQKYRAAALHGDMNQRKRTRTIEQMKKGEIKILVATDVAARGIDVQSISHIINFDLPQCPEDYIHRIGRTGRAGAKGTALSFATGRDRSLVNEIEKFVGYKIETAEIAGLEPSGKAYTESPKQPHNHRRQRPKPNNKGRFRSQNNENRRFKPGKKFKKAKGKR
jgi:superfamily II DNA/RNA helicase